MPNFNYRLSFFTLLLLVFASCAPSTPTSTDGPREVSPEFQSNVSTVYGFGPKVNLAKGLNVESDFGWKDSLGVQHSLKELKGKIVLVNFWAIWCTYCLDEMPALQDIQNRESPDSVVVMGVSIDNGATPFKDDLSFVQFKKFTYQMIVDANQDIYNNYTQENAIPQSFLIDQNGVIREYFNHEFSEKDYLNAIDALK